MKIIKIRCSSRGLTDQKETLEPYDSIGNRPDEIYIGTNLQYSE